MHWVYLCLAITFEVAGSTALKQSDGFTRPSLAIFSISSFVVALFFLSLAFRVVPLGIAYAIWAGIGITLISILGSVVFRQALDLAAVIGIGLIISGVIIITVFSNSAPQ